MSHLFKLLVCVLALIFTALVPSYKTKASIPIDAPQQQRIVTKKPWRKEPVTITAIKTKKKASIEIDKEFEDDDDWLDGFTVTVSNNYNKTVTVMTVEMVFRREPGDTRSPLAYPLHFGPSANSPEYTQRDPTKIIKVGKTANLELTDADYKNLKGYLAQTGYVNVKKVELVVTEVGFEDGSMIYSGTMYATGPHFS